MSKLGIFSVLALACIAVLATFQHHSELKLREENERLRGEVDRLPRVTSENQRLSNLVAQAKLAQVRANEQFQELIKVRAELNRLNQENQDSNRVSQAQISQSLSDQLRELTDLRNEIGGLSQEISSLRESIGQVASAGAANPAAAAETPADQTRTGDNPNTSQNPNQPLAIRMIETHGDTFAEKLKRSVAAQDSETFPEVFAKFLQTNGINTSTVAAAFYDERTGRVIVRASQPTLDQIEKVTLALDRAQ